MSFDIFILPFRDLKYQHPIENIKRLPGFKSWV